jgi:hypothetical protein
MTSSKPMGPKPVQLWPPSRVRSVPVGPTATADRCVLGSQATLYRSPPRAPPLCHRRPVRVNVDSICMGSPNDPPIPRPECRPSNTSANNPPREGSRGVTRFVGGRRHLPAGPTKRAVLRAVPPIHQKPQARRLSWARCKEGPGTRQGLRHLRNERGGHLCRRRLPSPTRCLLRHRPEAARLGSVCHASTAWRIIRASHFS